MDLSIIVPTYNRPDLLIRLFRSLEAAKPCDLRWEILVVDNNSPPEFRAPIEEAVRSSSLPQRLLFERTPGKCHALNSALREANGRFVAFLDDDVVVHEDYFTGVQESLARYPHKVFGGRVLPVWPVTPPDWVTGGRPMTTSRGPIVAHDYGGVPRLYDGSMRKPIGCNLICARELFDRFGTFDVRLGPSPAAGHMGGEETDLLRRFQAGGEALFYTPLVVVDHPVDPDRMTKYYFRYRHFCAGKAKRYTNRKQTRLIFGVPRFLYRSVATTTLQWLFAVATGRRLLAFDYQLELTELAGTMYEYRRTRDPRE